VKTPAERQQARWAAAPPTTRQLSYLSFLGFSGSVSSLLSASVTISALLTTRQG
jgi:hypothetical protein